MAASNLLDDIAAEVGQLTDAEIKDAADKILAQRAQANARMTPERKQKMKDRETQRRKRNAEIVKLARERGLVGTEA